MILTLTILFILLTEVRLNGKGLVFRYLDLCPFSKTLQGFFTWNCDFHGGIAKYQPKDRGIAKI